MSKGIGVLAKLLEKDDTWIIYQYAPFNWNYLEYQNPDYQTDGIIKLKIDALPIIEFHPRNSKKSKILKVKSKISFGNIQLMKCLRKDFST